MSAANPGTLPGGPDLGQQGWQVIADTATTNGDWFCIDVLTDCVFTTLTGNCSGTSGVTFAAGVKLFGRYSVIKLASGSVVAYKA